MTERSARDRLIVALDFDTADEAEALVANLGETVGYYKVGWQLFIGAGWPYVQHLLARGKRVFLDLKIGDIDNTVRAALNNMPDEFAGQLELLTLQGNAATVRAAKAGRRGEKPYLLMVTLLSSMDGTDLAETGAGSDPDVSAWIRQRAKHALAAGCEGLIASGKSVRELREAFPDTPFLIVTPGIRPQGDALDEHKRSLTPYQAIVDGADLLVVGRPIARAPRPQESATAILAEIERAVQDRAGGS
ncbi:MAG: orotidine-5'-phosphate decarboxylase [Gammaproteobacteria bacterium]|nr:orotidine-5'-phosphate decarboxylase [Gammaproteobacteria bacterium]